MPAPRRAGLAADRGCRSARRRNRRRGCRDRRAAKRGSRRSGSLLVANSSSKGDHAPCSASSRCIALLASSSGVIVQGPAPSRPVGAIEARMPRLPAAGELRSGAMPTEAPRRRSHPSATTAMLAHRGRAFAVYAAHVWHLRTTMRMALAPTSTCWYCGYLAVSARRVPAWWARSRRCRRCAANASATSRRGTRRSAARLPDCVRC